MPIFFPFATIKMVSISAESRCARKEVSSPQPMQQSKQMWRPKSIVVKEHTRALSCDTLRRNVRKEWRPKLKRKVEHAGQSKPPQQNVLERIHFPQQGN